MQNAVFARIVMLSLALLVTACASQNPYAHRSVVEEHRDILRGAAFFPVDEPLPELEPAQLLAVTDEMRAFLDEHIPVKTVSDEIKTDRILKGLLDDGLHIQYNNLKTYTAAETFREREGNCLSFTTLFIALAREAGVVVSYQEVEVPPSWSAVGDTHYFSLHINVLVDLRRKQKIVDFDVQSRSDKLLGTIIGDDTAAAQYDNNMAVFYLTNGDLPRAFQYSRRAILERPNTGYFWANLGTILRRAGEPDQAERAYLAAIDLSREPTALSNLARLYRRQGNYQQAEVYALRAEQSRSHNPYYLYELAEVAYEKGDFAQANELLRSAIKKRRDEPEFHRLYGLTWAQLNRPDKAEHSFELAVRHATDPQRASLYEHKLRLLAHTD
jgi:Flp pilus assembly protein TadD